MHLNSSQFRKFAILAARSADDKKAMDISLLDLKRTQGSISDYVLILSANSQVHLRILRQFVEESLEKAGLEPLHQDGMRSGNWTALDYGGLVVHIFR